MSVVICEKCDAQIDSDFDCDCFVEVGNMRRLHKTIVLCENCRDYEEYLRYEHDTQPKETP